MKEKEKGKERKGKERERKGLVKGISFFLARTQCDCFLFIVVPTPHCWFAPESKASKEHV